MITLKPVNQPRPDEITFKTWLQDIATRSGLTYSGAFMKYSRGQIPKPKMRRVNKRVIFVKIKMKHFTKLFDRAYAASHVCADICEKVVIGKEDIGDLETATWLLTEAYDLASAAQELQNHARGVPTPKIAE